MRSFDYLRSARNAAVIALALSVLPTCGAAAGSAPWVVVESHGDVAQQTADGMLPVAAGATLAEGAPIRTGADGALLIAHGNDRVTVSPNSAFMLPSAVDPATGPSILEMLGTLLFKVEHTPGRRFEVDTPYLAAVVKGTVFTVTVGAEQMVHVAEGAVEVTARASHESVLVKPGQTATLSSPGGMPAVIDRTSPAAEPGSNAPHTDKRSDATRAPVRATPRNAAASSVVRLTQTLGDQPLDVAALTNGLVKAGEDASTLAGAPDPNSSPGVSAGSSTDLSSATAAATAPSVGATPVVGATAVVNPVAATAVPVVVDTVTGVVHGAAATAKLLGANSPAATGRKLP
jgi:hypothetical protein